MMQQPLAPVKREEFAVVLDFLPYGRASEAMNEPICQLVGEEKFTLLEAVAKPGVKIDVGERVYIGSNERDKIDHIKGRVLYDGLTAAGQRELELVVRKMVEAKEKEFVAFVNRAGPINIRSHSLEHLPSIGKKHLEDILRARDKKMFESFADMQARVAHLGNPLEIFVQRVLLELHGQEKYYLFAKPPPREREERRFY